MSTLSENRRARHDYTILGHYEAGLVLTGPEVKSAKAGQVQLQGAFVIPKGNELWVTGMRIAPYPPAHGVQVGYDPTHDRKLLLTRRELTQLTTKMREQGLTVVPLSIYTAHRFIKLELGLGRGKTRYDKRASLRQRETKREIRRTLQR